MQLPAFAYERPRSVAEASELLTTRPGARALAGGQSLIPALALREREAGTLVDITRLGELQGISMAEGALRIGAATPMWDIERSPLVAEHAPLLVSVLHTVGAPGIRSRATLGGSIGWADPGSQLPAALLALQARVETTHRALPLAELLALAPTGTAGTSATGTTSSPTGAGNDAAGAALARMAAAAGGPSGFGSPVLAAGELVTAIVFAAGDALGHALRLTRRTHITWPTAGAAVVRRPGRVTVALHGAARRHLVATAPTAEAAATDVLAAIDPYDDEKSSAAHRRRVLPVLLERALAEAAR